MTPQERRLARATGILFILTFVSSIAGALLYDPVLKDTDYIVGGGSDTRIELGALCEIVLVITNIGTALALWPILKRQSEALALGYVASRIVESTMIAVGILSLLSLTTLHQEAGGASDESLILSGKTLVALHDWTFLMGPGFCVGVGNGILLGYLMYRSGLVPPRMAMLGLVGGPLLLVASTLVLFGAFEQTSSSAFPFAIPEILWEASLGIYLTLKGFRTSSPILDANRGTAPAADR